MSVSLAKPYTIKALHKYEEWIIQPKLDGVRAIFKDGNLSTRTGKAINPPSWFLNYLRETFWDHEVDGELIMCSQLLTPEDSKNQFQDVVSAVRKLKPVDEEWQYITFCVFDIKMDLPYSARYEYLLRGPEYPYLEYGYDHREFSLKFGYSHRGTSNIKAVSIAIIPTFGMQAAAWPDTMVQDFLTRALAIGFEGVMLRNARSPWVEGRTDHLLKVKPVYDDEATVVDVQPGKGKHEGRIGALICEMPNGKRFKVGTGLTDEERGQGVGYWINKLITYRYNEKTRAGMPRHPSFVTIRDYE